MELLFAMTSLNILMVGLVLLTVWLGACRMKEVRREGARGLTNQEIEKELQVRSDHINLMKQQISEVRRFRQSNGGGSGCS